MPIDINGNPSSTTGGKLTLASGVAMDANYIYTPQNPQFYGRYNAGNPNPYSAYPYPMMPIIDSGSNHSANTTFTCPIAGLYHISLAGIVQGPGNATVSSYTYGYGGPVHNGVIKSFYGSHTNNYWAPIHHMAVFDCAVGDTIKFAINVAPSPVGASAGMYLDINAFAITYIG